MVNKKTSKKKIKEVIDPLAEIQKINFGTLRVEEGQSRSGFKELKLLYSGPFDKKWNLAPSYYNNINNNVKSNLLTSFSFESRKNGLLINMSNIAPSTSNYSRTFTFILSKWDRIKALANLVCAINVLAGNQEYIRIIQSFQYSNYRRKNININSLDQTKRAKVIKAFTKSNEKFDQLPAYLEELLSQLKITVEHKAVLGREAVKSRVTDAFKVLQEYGYTETDVICLWREIVAESVVSS